MSENQETAPKTSSYYLFKPTSDEEAQLYKPKPIVNPEALETKPSVGSKWNTAGTFESQDFDQEDIHKVISNHYVGHTISKDGKTVTISELTNVKGDVSLTFSRGKKVITYDIDKITFRFTGTNGEDTECGGSITFHELDFASIDDFDIKYELDKNDSSHIALRNLVRSKEDELRVKFAEVVKSFLALTDE